MKRREDETTFQTTKFFATFSFCSRLYCPKEEAKSTSFAIIKERRDATLPCPTDNELEGKKGKKRKRKEKKEKKVVPLRLITP